MSVSEMGLPQMAGTPGPSVPGQVQNVQGDPQTRSFFVAMGQAMEGMGKEFQKFPQMDPVAMTRYSGMMQQAQSVMQSMRQAAQPPTMDQRVGIGAQSPATPPPRRVDALTGSPLADRAKAMLGRG